MNSTTTKTNKLLIGEYEPLTQNRGVMEAFIDDLKDGEVFWRIQLDRDSQMDVRRQEDAEIISRLVRIERLLKRGK